MGLKHIIVLQNKVDLIKRENAKLNYLEIRKFIQGTPAGKPIFFRSVHLTFIHRLTSNHALNEL